MLRLMRRRLTPIWVALLLTLLAGTGVSAHPLGNFTVNHYAGLEINPSYLTVDYVLDMAEIPAFQEIHRLDGNHNRTPDPEEFLDYPAQRCRSIQTSLSLQAAATELPLTLMDSQIAFPPGVANLLTLRLTCQWRATLPPLTASIPMQFVDRSDAHRLGWREITLTAAEGIPFSSELPTESLSQRLQAYPQERLSSPLDQRSGEFTLYPAGSVLVDNTKNSQLAGRSERRREIAASLAEGGSLGLLGRQEDAFTRLITTGTDQPAWLVALGIAFLWGGFHALTPGHGKSMVAAYLVGSRGTAAHALLLGLTTTVTHMAGVIGLGVLALGTSRWFLTEQLFPWLSLISGLLVIIIGISLCRQRWRRSSALSSQGVNSHLHGGIPDDISDSLGDPSPDHISLSSHSHWHEIPHHHYHHHPQHHFATGHPDHRHGSHHHHQHLHAHGAGTPHSHLPTSSDGAPLSWVGLLGLGISGGLMPCPSALVVMLSAIALHQVGLGLLLVTAFSLGLAAVLTGVGLVLIYAQPFFQQMPTRLPSLRFLPVASALLVTFMGLGMTAQALWQIYEF
ncbi:MAG: sulfite exporter TauE/SafE family protein [Cyanobacteriota bacterium]|nr:sulfite exporter TauE/SafE family protein [Cyanobacteriota bacterium]